MVLVKGPNTDNLADKKDFGWNYQQQSRGNVYIARDFNGRVERRDDVYNNIIETHGQAIRNNICRGLLDLCMLWW